MIKLIASDMDGSLLDENKKLPKEFFDTLNRLKEKGVAFVVASGRSFVTLYQDFRPNSDSLDYICDNGAFVVVNSGITNIDVIKRESLHALLTACSKIQNSQIILCGVKGTYHLNIGKEFNNNIRSYYINVKIVESLFDVYDDIFKIAICDLNGPENNSYKILKEQFGNDLELQISGSVWMDIMNKGVSKGVALKKIQQNLGVTFEETMAFGDFYNDIELLKNAKYSFVMTNANEDMFQYGNYRAKSNAEHGVIKAIEEYVLNK